MTSKGLLQRLRWPRLQLPPSWGIEPVPESSRQLRLLDHFVLWSSLGVGLLVLEAGALLVPALNLGTALVAILVGTAVGVLLLALAGLIGAGTGVPTMVLLRPALGLRGSFLPTALNLAQLIGWTAFEFWVMALAGGAVALVVILVDETDNAFADIYSAAVSLQNLWPHLSQRLLVALIGLVSLLLAAFLTMTEYFNFLLLIGSFFVPLFGLLAGDYFVLRRRHYQVEALYRSEGIYWYNGGVNWVAVVVWLLGAGVYHLIARSVPWLGASLPAFVVTFLGYLLAARLLWGRQLWPSQGS
jgi:purine-cytosine permease-like protein